MKRIIAFALVLVMCLCLAACGSSDKEKLYDKYETLISALEEKNYEDAMKELYSIYNNAETETETGGSFWNDVTGGNTPDADTETEEEQPDPEVEAMKAVIPGEWLPELYRVENDGFTSIVINEDGTATFCEKSYTWEIDSMYSTYGYITLLDGDTSAYRLGLNKRDDGTYYVSLSEYSSDGNSTTWCGEFYRAADYTKIEITAENWDEYFEFVENAEISKDAFGDATSISVDRSYVLKEEYGDVNTSLSKTVIEYSYKEIRAKFSADLKSGTYSMGGIVDDYADSDPYTSTTTLYDVNVDGDDEYRYGMSFGSFYIDEFPEDTVWYNTDFKILRILSTIYVNNTAE